MAHPVLPDPAAFEDLDPAGELHAGAPPADPATRALREALRDRQQRQERLGHVQEFLTSPAFLDLRAGGFAVSDPPEALEERRRDLDYRIAVLEAMLALLTEERALLDRATPAAPPEPGGA